MIKTNNSYSPAFQSTSYYKTSIANNTVINEQDSDFGCKHDKKLLESIIVNLGNSKEINILPSVTPTVEVVDEFGDKTTYSVASDDKLVINNLDLSITKGVIRPQQKDFIDGLAKTVIVNDTDDLVIQRLFTAIVKSIKEKSSNFISLPSFYFDIVKDLKAKKAEKAPAPKSNQLEGILASIGAAIPDMLTNHSVSKVLKDK
jgi:hypothetical protein